MSVEVDYLKHHIWLSVLIAIVGLLVVVVCLILLFFLCRYCRRRCRGQPTDYTRIRFTRDIDEDSISYGSMELRKDNQALAVTTAIQVTGGDAADVKPTDSKASTSQASARKPANGKPANGKPANGKAAQPGQSAAAPREIGLYEAMEHQRKSKEISERESAVLNCQFYILNTHRYNLLQTLKDMGSRMHKYWFSVNPIRPSGGSPPPLLLLTVVPVSKQCPIRLQEPSLRTLNELLKALQCHPYIHPLTEIDYMRDKQLVVAVQPFMQSGSLKDIIYKSQPMSEWSVKYSVQKKGLPLETVALYGRQILEAVAWLYRRGFPQLGHIQNGNVFVEGTTCRLSGYENTLLGYKARLFKLLKDHQDSIDVIMFGHLLFEMSCGYELTTLEPTTRDYQNLKYPPLHEVLQFIFSNESGAYPSIDDVLELPFFQQVQLPKLQSLAPEKVQMTAEMKALLRAVRKGRPVQLVTKTKRRSARPVQEDDGTTKYPITPLRLPSAIPPTKQPPQQNPQTQNTAAPKTAAPHPPPPGRPAPPPRGKSDFTPPPKTKNRSALLGDIRKGKKLKKTVTNDRSAPRIG